MAIRRRGAVRGSPNSHVALHTQTSGHDPEVLALHDRQEQLEAQLELTRRELAVAATQNAELERRLVASQAQVDVNLQELTRVQEEGPPQNRGSNAANELAADRESLLKREIDLLQCAYVEMADINAEHESMHGTYRDSMSRKSFELDALREEIVERDCQLARLQRTIANREIEAAEHAEGLRLALLESEAQRAADAEEFVILLAART